MAEILPLIIVALVIVSSVARYRLVRAAQPLRLMLAQKGELLLAQRGLSTEVQEIVEFMLDTAFGNRTMLIAGLVLTPIIAASLIFRPSKFAEFMKRTSIADPESQSLYSEVWRLHERIMLANHPILYPIAELEIFILALVGILLVALMRGHIPMNGDRESFLSFIEANERRLWGGRKAEACRVITCL